MTIQKPSSLTRRTTLTALVAASAAMVLPSRAFSENLATDMQQAFKDKKFRSLFINHVTANYRNAGFAPGRIDVGFSLADMPRPQDQQSLGLSGFGFDLDNWATGELRHPSKLAQLMSETMGGGAINQEVLQEYFEASKAVSSFLENSGKTGFLVETAAVITIVAGIVTIGSIGFSTGYMLAKDAWEFRDADGDGVRNGLDKWPNDKTRSFKANEVDSNGNGVPDIYELEMLAYLRAAGIGLREDAEIGARVSLLMKGDDLIIDSALGQDREISSRLVVNLSQ